MAQYRVEFDTLPWNMPAPGVRSRVFRQGGRQVRLVELGKEFVEAEWCLKGHIGYVVFGRLEIAFADGTVLGYLPGDGIFIPKGPEHGHKARALSDVARVILVEDE